MAPPASKAGALQSQLGLGEPTLGPAGSSEQAKKFLADFQGIMAPANEALRYTRVNAEKSKHDPYVTEETNIYTYFQTAQKRIDPNEEKTAQGDIDVVLGQARGFVTKVSGFKQATETSLNAWKQKEPDYTTAVTKIEELEAWKKDDQATKDLRTSSNDILKTTNDRKYDEAVTKFGQLKTNLDPVHEEYKKQKAAKDTFVPNWNSIKPGVDAALIAFNGQAPTEALKTPQQQIKTTKEEIDKQVSEKNYVAANASLDKLSPQVAAFKKAHDEYTTAKKAYETRWPNIKAAADKAAQEQLKSENITTAKGKLKPSETSVVSHVGAKDYVAAVKSLDELEANLQEFEKAKQECVAAQQAFTSAWTTMKPEVEKALTEKVESDPSKTAQQSLRTAKDEIVKAETAKEYVKAKTLLDKVTPLLAEFKKVYKEEKSSVKYFKPKFSMKETTLNLDLNVEKEILVQFENAPDLAADAKIQFATADARAGSTVQAFGLNVSTSGQRPIDGPVAVAVETKPSTGIFKIKSVQPGNVTLKYVLNATQGQDSARWEVPQSTSITVKKSEMSVTDVGKGPFRPENTTSVRLEFKNVNKAKEVAKATQKGKFAVLEGNKSAAALNGEARYVEAWTAEERWDGDNILLITLKADHSGESKVNIEVDLCGTIHKHSASVKCVSSKDEFLARMKEARGAKGQIEQKFSTYLGSVFDNIRAAKQAHEKIIKAEKADEMVPLVEEYMLKAVVATNPEAKMVGLAAEFLLKFVNKNAFTSTADSLQAVSAKLPGFSETIEPAKFTENLTIENSAQHCGTATIAMGNTCENAILAWEKWAAKVPPKTVFDFDPADALVKSAKIGNSPLLSPPPIPSAADYETVFWRKWVELNRKILDRTDEQQVGFIKSKPVSDAVYKRLDQLGVSYPGQKVLA
jgi:hypothetical protein